eukprot:gene12600-6420_t
MRKQVSLDLIEKHLLRILNEIKYLEVGYLIIITGRGKHTNSNGIRGVSYD